MRTSRLDYVGGHIALHYSVCTQVGGAGVVRAKQTCNLAAMAVQGRGYYGIGAAKKDFGFSSNLTLPLSGGLGWSQSDAMPTESRSDKGHASFTVDKHGKVRRSR